MENEEKNILDNSENIEKELDLQPEATEVESIFEDFQEEELQEIAEEFQEIIEKETDESDRQGLQEAIIQETVEESQENFEQDIKEEILNEDVLEYQVDEVKEETAEEKIVAKPIETTNIVEVEENIEENDGLITVRPVKFQQFEQIPPIRTIKKNLDIMQDVSMHVSVELGRTKSSIREVMEMEQGSVVELEKIAGEQVEIFINDKLVAKGEVIVIEDRFGVRITSTNIQKQI